MQTAFTPEQLADPQTASSEKIIRTCVHCGFCLATCPTYVLLGDERDSPRGRIYLMKDMLETGKAATPEIVTHIDRCLSCLACMTTCPSGVNYMHLVDHGRAYIERTYRRPFFDRLTRGLVARVLPYPRRFKAALGLARLSRPLAPLFARVAGLKPMAAMLRLAPARLPAGDLGRDRRVFPAQGVPRGRVAILRGCAQSVLGPGINAAAIRLLTRHGVECVLVEGEECCGALVHHMGREHQALAQARAIIDTWLGEADAHGLDAILVTASGCGTTIKDYAFILREDAAYAAKAARVSALAKDVTEYLAVLGIEAAAPSGLTVAYHSACSMQHGQRVTREPRALLEAAGFALREIGEGHLCCGSAGTYNILQPEIAARLRDRKLENIARTGADLVATGNLGCMTQLASDAGLPLVHTVELLDWATGGPRPEALRDRPEISWPGASRQPIPA